MNIGSNHAFDHAALLEQQERDAAIADAIAEVSRPGAAQCVDCHHAILAGRLAAAPFAIRCIECQKFHEAEKYHR